MNALTSWLVTSSYNFDGKRGSERVVHFLYRHWLVLVSKILGAFFLLILPVIVYILLVSITALGTRVTFWFSLLLPIYYLLVWSSFCYTITMYLMDTWIVTDQRILDNTQHGFFSRTVSELELSRIQDVTVTISGLIPTLLDFGNIEVQTAGSENKFIFLQVPHPQKVREEIMALVGER